ncbi:MAG: hypothetical protein Tsb0032_18980 [Kiloniellaceae bacterium]
MTVAVFLGPSLPRAEAETVLQADYRPPVRQGDIYRLVQRNRPRAIAVIDGYFQEVPSVWHKEILWALDQGVQVYGAASMGALRAAELDRHGMVGVGKIYEAYRVGSYAPYEGDLFEDDDEVAVIHGPAELSYPPLSVAMVDLRETLAAAARAGVIDEGLRDSLVAAFKGRFYRERNFDLLPELLAELEVEAGVAEALLVWLPEGRISQKRADARALLEGLATSELEPPAERESFVFERTTLWAQFVEQAAAQAPALSDGEQRVLEELRLQPDLFGAMQRLAVLRHGLEAGELPPPPDAAARRAALDRLRRRHGLLSRAALEDWAADCDLDKAGLDRLLDYEATLALAAEAAGPALDAALLDVLRGEGHYPALAARARDKRARLAAAEEQGTAPSALSSDALLDWYLETRLGRSAPASMADCAREFGFEDAASLLAALARERTYLALCEEAR